MILGKRFHDQPAFPEPLEKVVNSKGTPWKYPNNSSCYSLSRWLWSAPTPKPILQTSHKKATFQTTTFSKSVRTTWHTASTTNILWFHHHGDHHRVLFELRRLRSGRGLGNDPPSPTTLIFCRHRSVQLPYRLLGNLRDGLDGHFSMAFWCSPPWYQWYSIVWADPYDLTSWCACSTCCSIDLPLVLC